jgi:hypothetical protein
MCVFWNLLKYLWFWWTYFLNFVMKLIPCTSDDNGNMLQRGLLFISNFSHQFVFDLVWKGFQTMVFFLSILQCLPYQIHFVNSLIVNSNMKIVKCQTQLFKWWMNNVFMNVKRNAQFINFWQASFWCKVFMKKQFKKTYF